MEKQLQNMSVRPDTTDEIDKKPRMMDDRMNAMSKRVDVADEFDRNMKEMEVRLSRNNAKSNNHEWQEMQTRIEIIEKKQASAATPAPTAGPYNGGWTPMHIVMGGWTGPDGKEKIKGEATEIYRKWPQEIREELRAPYCPRAWECSIVKMRANGDSLTTLER